MNHDQSPWRDPVVRVFFFLMVTFIAICLLAIRAADPAEAHEATNVQGQPQGWRYALECCSEKDCAPAAIGDVTPRRDGYWIESLQILVPYDDRRLRKAPDGLYHSCVGVATGALLCLYTPDMGS